MGVLGSLLILAGLLACAIPVLDRARRAVRPVGGSAIVVGIIFIALGLLLIAADRGL